jgi:Cyclic nucleotide-binding domain
MRIERSATSLSWIPSDSIPGIMKVPFARGLMHYDPPPPLHIEDLETKRRRGEFRFANRLSAWIEVSEGKVTSAGYSGATIMGLTPLTAGPLQIMLPTKRNPEIQHAAQIIGSKAIFVQTAGGRPGFSFLKPALRWPFVVTRPYTIWTTIELVISADGTCTQRLVGASPFPRHWLYDDKGDLVEKAALTRLNLWAKTVFGTHTPWGGEDEAPAVADPETELERMLSEQIMRQPDRPTIRHLKSGEFLFRQAEQATSVALILDGNFDVRVDGKTVGRVGPGTIVGERASLESGRRTADLLATTDARIGEVPAERLEPPLLEELALGHRREETQAEM